MSRLLHDKKIPKGISKKKSNWRKRAVWAAVSALVFALFLAPGPVFAVERWGIVSVGEGIGFQVRAYISSTSLLGGECASWSSTALRMNPPRARPVPVYIPEWIHHIVTFRRSNSGSRNFDYHGIRVLGRNSNHTEQVVHWQKQSLMEGKVCIDGDSGDRFDIEMLAHSRVFYEGRVTDMGIPIGGRYGESPGLIIPLR